MGPRVVAWSKEEVLTHWRDQPKIPLIVDDEETVLLTVRDVSRLKAQKNNKDTNNGNEDGEIVDNNATSGHTAKDKGKGKVIDDDGMNSNEEDDEDDDMPPRPPPRRHSTFLADVHARHNFSESPPSSPRTENPTPTSRVKTLKSTKPSAPKPGPSKPANARTRAMLEVARGPKTLAAVAESSAGPKKRKELEDLENKRLKKRRT
ncbi:hypothetical protein VKT23_013658 [Stygiomarasmius scandens]|uniref:Uncharacterized protein n=1 Tax=Marasmiellus scandens TaxID=2682957 RepID=A0ABR1J3E3_9AGAR